LVKCNRRRTLRLRLGTWAAVRLNGSPVSIVSTRQRRNTMHGAEKKTYHDSTGDPFAVMSCRTEDFLFLLEMYDTFMPEPVAQGLPPLDRQTRQKWIKTLLTHAENFVAIREGRVVGHSALVPNLEGRNGEYLIFVASPHRKRGLATVLTTVAIEKAGELGLESIWLTVEADNFRAIRLYRKMGFQFCDKGVSERKMELRI
jgi:RimJ/RimL family protein N-acetyltransferase